MVAARAIIASLLLAVATFMLPAYLYQGSTESIGLPLANFLMMASVCVLASAAFAFAALAILRFSEWGIAIVAGVGVAIALKIHVAPSAVPILDGEEQFASALSLAGLFSIATMALFPVAIYAARRLSTSTLGVLLAAMVAFALAPTVSGEQKPFDSTAFTSHVEAPFFSLSREGNVIVVLLDALPSDIFAEIAAEDADVRETMEGFTYFPNTTSNAPTTLMNMIAVYSGRQYDGGGIRDNYRAAAEDGLFSDANAAGMDTALSGFTPVVCPADNCYQIDEMTGFSRFDASISSFLNLVQVGHLRTVPTIVQAWLYNSGLGRFSLFAAPEGHVNQSIAALRHGAEALTVEDKPQPTFRFLHVFITHPPITANQACAQIPQQDPTRTNYKAQAICGVHGFIALLETMRAQGIYDNSVIVLIADHGTATHPAPGERPTLLEGVSMGAGRSQRFNPVFAVKPRNATGPLTVNQSPTTNADLRATLCAIAFSCNHDVPGENAFAITDADRQRRFIDFRYTMSQLLRRDSLPAEGVTEYVIGGDISEVDRAIRHERRRAAAEATRQDTSGPE